MGVVAGRSLRAFGRTRPRAAQCMAVRSERRRLRATGKVETAEGLGVEGGGSRWLARGLVGAGLAVALANGLGGLDALAAVEQIVDKTNVSENLLSDFYVQFGGEKIDHKIIVELVVLGQTIGFIGALVGGISARSRKEEVENLNEKLKAVNRELRQQARLDAKKDVIGVKAVGETEEVDNPMRSEIIGLLRSGKESLRQQHADNAISSFELALEKAGKHGDALENVKKVERKAYRGLGGAHQLNGDYEKALEYMQLVLKLSREMKEHTGVGDALGVIADIYTDMGNLEKAGEWYDKYIAAMTSDEEEQYSQLF